MKPVIVGNKDKDYVCKTKEKCVNMKNGKCTLLAVTTVNGECVMHS